MEEKQATKISLSTFLLIIAIIAIIIMGVFIYKLNNDKTREIQKSANLQSQVNSLNGTVSDLQGKINTISQTINTNSSNVNTINNSADIKNDNASSANSNNTSIKYLDMTEENYKKYNNEDYVFQIHRAEIDSNGKIIIKGRVYEKIQLDTISKKQYEDIIQGKSITIYGEEYTLANNTEDNKMSLKNNNGVEYYIVMKNDDGSAKIRYGGHEMIREKATEVYMQITLDEKLNCKFGEDTRTLKQILFEDNNNTSNNIYENKEFDKEYIWAAGSDEFVFKNGKCTSIIFSNT